MSRNRGELFGSQQEKTVSGFMVGPLKELRGSREPRKDQGEHYPNRASYSGPLAPGYGLSKVPKELDHSSTLSTDSNISTLSSLVACRTGDGNQEKSGPLVPSSMNKVNRLSGSINSMEALVRRQDSKYYSRRNDDIPLIEGKISSKESAVVCYSTPFSPTQIMC